MNDMMTVNVTSLGLLPGDLIVDIFGAERPLVAQHVRRSLPCIVIEQPLDLSPYKKPTGGWWTWVLALWSVDVGPAGQVDALPIWSKRVLIVQRVVPITPQRAVGQTDTMTDKR